MPDDNREDNLNRYHFLSLDGAQEVATALAEQKSRFENRLKELQEHITQKVKEKMTGMKNYGEMYRRITVTNNLASTRCCS